MMTKASSCSLFCTSNLPSCWFVGCIIIHCCYRWYWFVVIGARWCLSSMVGGFLGPSYPLHHWCRCHGRQHVYCGRYLSSLHASGSCFRRCQHYQHQCHQHHYCFHLSLHWFLCIDLGHHHLRVSIGGLQHACSCQGHELVLWFQLGLHYPNHLLYATLFGTHRIRRLFLFRCMLYRLYGGCLFPSRNQMQAT